LPRDLQNIECINVGTRWFTGESEILA